MEHARFMVIDPAGALVRWTIRRHSGPCEPRRDMLTRAMSANSFSKIEKESEPFVRIAVDCRVPFASELRSLPAPFLKAVDFSDLVRPRRWLRIMGYVGRQALLFR